MALSGPTTNPHLKPQQIGQSRPDPESPWQTRERTSISEAADQPYAGHSYVRHGSRATCGAAIMSGALRSGTFIRVWLGRPGPKTQVGVTPVQEALLKTRGEGDGRARSHISGHVVLLPLTRQDIDDIFWLQPPCFKNLHRPPLTSPTLRFDELDRISNALAGAIRSSDANHRVDRVSFHRVFSKASRRIKLAWFLLNAARYMGAGVHPADRDGARTR